MIRSQSTDIELEYFKRSKARPTNAVSPMEPVADARRRITKYRIVQIFVDLLASIAIFVIFICVHFASKARIQSMRCDMDIFFPNYADTVPFYAVGLYGTIAPLIFIILVEIFNAVKMQGRRARKFLYCQFLVCVFHAASLFVVGLALTLLLTEIGKKFVGRLRPRFIAVCQPVTSNFNCTSPGLTGTFYNSIYTGDSFCTNTNSADVEDARMSFPSGHSSYSWYSMLFLIIYLEARLMVLTFRYVKVLVQLAAFSTAWLVCLSRVADYAHRLSDVFAGSVLGIIIAVFVTCVIGRVLWAYKREKRVHDYDLLVRSEVDEEEADALKNNSIMDSTSDNAIIDLERGSSAELIPEESSGTVYTPRLITTTRKEALCRYFSDFTVILGMLGVFLLLNLFFKPRISYFTCDQSDLFYPFKKDTVPVSAVFFFGVLMPIVLIALIEAIHANLHVSCGDKELDRAVYDYRVRSFRVFVNHYLGIFVLGVAITLLLTEFAKRWFGRLRPHFMSVCKPDFTYFNCTMEVNKGAIYTSMDTGGMFCKGDPRLVEEARLSFPSGHSSMSWYCMIFFIIYLERRMSSKRFRFFKVSFQMACFIGALVTSISRISDYHHRGSDVLGGTVLGAAIAFFILFVVGRVLWEIEKREKYFLIGGASMWKKRSEERDQVVNVV